MIQGLLPRMSVFRSAAIALCTLAATAASAETLRVGKAGRDAFSFAPADIGQRCGDDVVGEEVNGGESSQHFGFLSLVFCVTSSFPHKVLTN